MSSDGISRQGRAGSGPTARGQRMRRRAPASSRGIASPPAQRNCVRPRCTNSFTNLLSVWTPLPAGKWLVVALGWTTFCGVWWCFPVGLLLYLWRERWFPTFAASSVGLQNIPFESCGDWWIKFVLLWKSYIARSNGWCRERNSSNPSDERYNPNPSRLVHQGGSRSIVRAAGIGATWNILLGP